LHPIVRDEIYRIAREALRNAFSHARAHHIEAEITYADGCSGCEFGTMERALTRSILEEGRPATTVCLECASAPTNRREAEYLERRRSRHGDRVEHSGSIAYGKSPAAGPLAVAAFRKKGGMKIVIRILSVDDHALLREGIAALVGNQSDMELVAEGFQRP
jgi:hypothetical protein